ncbi:MAG: hypothetical protein P8N90_09825, partial [Glaciecola sp.]|nr:hypothetical protein [Glaciecola sp.]
QPQAINCFRNIATFVAGCYNYHQIKGNNMATASIRLDEAFVEKATIMGKALNRTTPKQIEHWAKN